MMAYSLAISALALTLLVAILHSVIGERHYLRPLFAAEARGVLANREKRAILRLLWHLPSFVWPLLALGVVFARSCGGEVTISAVAAIAFLVSGAGNLLAHRRPFIGGLMLLAIAGLIALDALQLG